MKKIYIFSLTTLLLWGAVGCKKPSDFGDTNLDPSGTAVPRSEALLANAEVAVAGLASTDAPAINGAQYAQYFTETQYSATSLYSLPQLSFTGYYNGALFDLQTVINLNKSKNQTTVAKILQQYIYWVVTDAWGDVPYSDALKGIEAITPKYDKQEDIYKGILASLDEAVTTGFDSSPISGDLIYGGDVASWKKAANSLRMLVAIQLSKKVPAASGFAATAFKDALADGAGYINDNAQNLKLTYPGGSFKSDWWQMYNGRKDYAESETMTFYLGALADPRIATFGGASEDPSNKATSSIGVPYGTKRETTTAFTDANPTWARVLRSDFRQENGDVNIITAAEVALARAEAANIGWTTEPLIATYEAGIALSFNQWGLPAPSAAYLSGANVALTVGSADNVELIAIQRWIASYPDGHMAWNIWRKSGFPALDPAPDATSASGDIVRRFTYAQSEYNTNGENVAEAIKNIPGGDTQDSRVWWDQ